MVHLPLQYMLILLGTVGLVCLFAAFFLNAGGRLASTSFWYNWLNSFGGFLLAYFALTSNDAIFAILNVFWGAVAFWHLARLLWQSP